MQAIYVPCPRCHKFIEVMAYETEKPQEVFIKQHESNIEGEAPQSCEFFGRHPLPAPDRDWCFAERDGSSLMREIRPENRGPDPEAIAEERPLVERMGDYFMGCPFSILLKHQARIEAAYEALESLSSIFPEASQSDEFDPYDDTFTARIKDVHEVIEKAMEARLTEGLRLATVDQFEHHIEFRDDRSGEFVPIPFSAILVSQSRMTRFKPNGVPADHIRPFNPPG